LAPASVKQLRLLPSTMPNSQDLNDLLRLFDSIKHAVFIALQLACRATGVARVSRSNQVLCSQQFDVLKDGRHNCVSCLLATFRQVAMDLLQLTCGWPCPGYFELHEAILLFISSCDTTCPASAAASPRWMAARISSSSAI